MRYKGITVLPLHSQIQVAIKCLSKERMQTQPMEFLKEASIMHNINSEHIVRLYGVVLDTNTLMLVSLLECYCACGCAFICFSSRKCCCFYW